MSPMRKRANHQRSMHVSIKESTDVMSARIEYFEEIGNWRNVIFLPFNMVWRILVMITTVLNCNLVAYILLYERSHVSLTVTLYYICEGIYCINTILCLLHRTMKYKMTKSHMPKNAYLIFLDIISLLPYYELYYLLMRTSYGIEYDFAEDNTRVKVFLRVFSVLAFFINTNNEPGLNHLLAMTVFQVVCYSLYCIFFSGLWFIMGQQSHPGGWTRNLEHHYFNNESTIHEWVISNTFISSLFFHSWSGIITPILFREYLIILATMLVAFLLQIIFYSNLKSLYIKQISDQYHYSYRLYVIRHLLDKWNISMKLKKSVIKVYNTFWEKRFGRSKMPSIFYTCLPYSLQREVRLDTFWQFLHHSHLFNDTDIAFNRNMCLSMKSKFLMAGEFLYTKGELKDKTVYIVSGVIQLLSMDDQNSPVISFSSGTVLGEICCLMSVESSSYLRCATYCEIQVLQLTSLAFSMLKYRSISKILWDKLHTRLELAKRLQHPELLKLKSKEERRTSIRWFKSQWRLIAELAKQAKRSYDGSEIPIVPYHFSKFLSLYVLSGDVELKTRAICLKSECPFVLDPRNKFKLFCDYIVLIVVFIQGVYLPYYIIFKKELTVGQVGLFYTLDVFYFFALYLHTSTAVKTKDKLISNIWEIIIYKGKQITVMIDIFATIPLEVFASMLMFNARVADLLHLNRTLKVYRVVNLVHMAQLNVWLDYTRLRIIKYLLLYLLILYYFASITYALVCFWDCQLTGWYVYNKILKSLLDTSRNGTTDAPTPFISALTYVTSSMLGTARGDIFAYNVSDLVLEQIICNVGYYLICYCFAEIGACAVMNLKNQFDFREYIFSLKYFAQRHNFPIKLTDMMYRAMHCLWMFSNFYEVSGKFSVIKHLPQSLRETIVTSRIINCLKTLPLFQGCDEKLLVEVASISKLQVCPPDMTICRMDYLSSYVFIILSGYCRVESSIPTDKYHEVITTISYGNCFPCIEALLEINSFVQVTSITYLEVITINVKDLMRVFEHYSDEYNNLIFVLNEHLEENKTVLTRQKGRLPDMLPSKKSKGRGEFFEYKCLDDRETDEKDYNEFYNAFKVLGRWKFIRHIFLRKTIEPTSPFYYRWEIIRCLISTLHVIYSFTLLKLTLFYNMHQYVELIIILIGLVDFYIRMHIRYCNKIGILVTHPLYTAGHYISTSFSLDLIGIFPIYTLSLNAIFGRRHRVRTLIIMVLLTRPLQLYRVYKAICYLQSKAKEKKYLFYENVKYLMLILLVIGMSALTLEGYSCTEQAITSNFSCSNTSWMFNPDFRKEYGILTPTLISYYVVFAMYSSSTIGTFKITTNKDMMVLLALTIILFGVRWFVLAKITSTWIGGNKALVQYQHRMNVFMYFCKYYRVTNSLVTEILAHYEHLWEVNKSFTNMSHIINRLHPTVRADFHQFMYGQYWMMTEIFHDADKSIIRYISRECIQVHFKKDSIIIHANDINNMLYLVCKGQVEITIADYTIGLLNPGGIFGCFQPHSATRQTITVKSTVHITLLVINSSKFTSLLKGYPKYRDRIKNLAILCSEYTLPKRTRFTRKRELSAFSDIVGTHTLQLTKQRKHRFLVYADKTWYHIYNHITDVHLSMWSSILISLIIIRIGVFDLGNFWYRYLYIIDIVYWIKIIINFHLTYYDRETGILVTNHTYIAKRYLKSWSGFWLDIVTTFPFEVFVMGFKSASLVHGCCMNRALRFIFIFIYYGTWKKRLTMTRLQRWIYLIYIIILMIHSTACFWWLVACPQQVCTQVWTNNHLQYERVKIKNPLLSFMLSVFHIVNIFTSTGFKIMAPDTVKELGAMIFIICAGQFTAMVLTICFANMIVLKKFMMSEYERKAKHIWLFMQATNVSASLRTKVWSYFVSLWIRGYGSWLPDLIRDAPNNLKQKIMCELYGRYLGINCLFKGTHIDFLRQLAMHLEPNVFLPGMYIVEKGDVDACMYFIQKGEIIVFDKHGNNEIEQATLGRDQSFGELQGIYGIPHDRSYKARFHSQVLRLQKSDWIELLQWFPASKDSIQDAINLHFKKTDTFI